MDSNNTFNPHHSSDEEFENAEEAYQEIKNFGSTSRRCLKCGGSFIFYESQSGYTIRCENSDFNMTVRGI